MTPVVWSIAGSDCGGGAGVQADLKAIHEMSAHGACVVTALTAQNTRRVVAAEPVSLAMFRAQWDALKCDLPPRAVKIGMIAAPDLARELAERISSLDCPVVLDPVLVASSGDALSDRSTREIIVDKLLPLATLVTPNLPEAEALTGMKIDTEADLAAAGQALLARGAKAVLIKGGHRSGADSVDTLFEAGTTLRFAAARVEKEAHGTGCTLSAAIAARLALGDSLRNAVVLSRELVHRALRNAQGIGRGFPLLDFRCETTAEDFPSLEPRETALSFPRVEERLGFYLIVDSLEWVERAIAAGVKTIQLRKKNASEPEIARAIKLGKDAGVRLFINDAWELAIRHEAYGVHLGQSDLVNADLSAIAGAGLKLGISTHDPFEIALAKGIAPSYCAIGTVFPTTLKKMPYPVVGPERLAIWRKYVACPVVAIGGITLEKAPQILRAGVDSIAVVSDVTAHPDPSQRIVNWLELLH